MAETMLVTTHPNQGQRVGFWERHPDHPGGEVWVAGQGQAVEVARTPAALQAIREDRIAEVRVAEARRPARADEEKTVEVARPETASETPETPRQRR